MRANLSHLVLIFLFLLLCNTAYTQEDSSFFNRILSLPDKVFGKVDRQSQQLTQKLNNQTEKYLSKLERREQQLKRKLWHTDSVKAKEVFGNVEERYANLKDQLKTTANQPFSAVYSGHADSLTTALTFLNNSPALQNAKGISANLKNVRALQNKFNQTETIRKQIKARQDALKQQLQNTPVAKEFAKYKKQVYYYQAQVKEYRTMLNDPKFMGAKLLDAARKIPLFDQFFKNNSELAGLFALPGSSAASSGFVTNPNLQTRVQVGQILQQQFTGTASSSGQFIQQGVSNAQSQINQLKQKFTEFGNSDNSDDIPDFKPNNQKTKPFVQRFELGSNLQTTRARSFFPVTTDIGLSLGYKLNSKSIIGFGGSFKMGWGTGFNQISITGQGAGLRTFFDWKASSKASRFKILSGLWLSGGYEQNYFAVFRSFSELNNRAVWKPSALFGISKVIDIKSKIFKKTKVQLLYDFLWQQQLPQTQPLLFRFGYNF